MSKEATSMVWDYIVFVIFLLGSTFVAVYSRFSGPKEKTKADYVFATGSVSICAMMLSIARGTLGVRSFLGYPSELYYRGSAMWETVYGLVLAYPIVCFVFVPVYYSLGITSVYQYLDLRFKSRLVRCLASGTYILRQLLNQGVTVFTPCVALNTVIGIPYWASIVGISAVSIIFSLLGGLKAAILADVLQGLTMILVSLAIIVQGTVDIGGFGEVYNVAVDRGRLKFFNFDLDPTIRVTTTSAIIGQLFMSLSILGCQQNFVQRYCSMDSQKKVTKTLVCNIPVITVLFSLSWVVGMVIFATYANCDPKSAGYIDKFDEILPFFVEDRFNYLPGILGLFLASLFNGAFSLNVSILNSLATVTWEDFLSHIPGLKDLKDAKQLRIIKSIVVVYGCLIMGISFGVGLLSGVIESSMLVTSATSGPLLGVFILAILVPCCNWKGAATGMIVAHCVTLWITWGGLSVDKPLVVLPLSTDGCSNGTFNDHIKPELPWATTTAPTAIMAQDVINTTTTLTTAQSDLFGGIYSITYMYYSFIGCFITVSLGWLVSCLVGSTDSDVYDEQLLHPVALKISRWLPGRPRRFADKGQSSQTDANRNKVQRDQSSTSGSVGIKVPLDTNDVQLEAYRTKL